jgi:hypothetical protein
MDPFFESAWSEDDYHATELAGDIAPAMGTLCNGDARACRRLKDFFFNRDAIATCNDHKMLLLVAMKMHRRVKSG